MNLTPWKSGSVSRGRMNDEMASFQREMSNLVNSFFNRGELTMPQLDSSFFPSLDLKEKDNKYFMDVDVPGMSESDIDIDLHGNTLTIKGEKKAEKETKDNDYICVERSHGSFRRDIYLDQEVDQANIKADLKNGVLHLELPKKAEHKEGHKKIQIKH